MSKILSIVIPVYNKFNFTKSALSDLSKLPNDHEIIIVDNGSTDETQAQLSGSKEVIYYRNEKNYGFASASNRGYSLSTAPNVLMLNNDIRVKSNHEGWTQELIKWCHQGLIGPTMGQLDSNLNFVQEANRLLLGNSYMSGWCLASSKEIWDKLAIRREPTVIYDRTPPPQIFSEEFGLAYFEDTDLSFRAKKLKIGFHVVEIPVVHFGRQSSSQLNTHALYKQARQIFVKKWSKMPKIINVQVNNMGVLPNLSPSEKVNTVLQTLFSTAFLRARLEEQLMDGEKLQDGHIPITFCNSPDHPEDQLTVQYPLDVSTMKTNLDNMHALSIGWCFAATNAALEEVFGLSKKQNNPNDSIKALRAISASVRNAASHNPAESTWHITDKYFADKWTVQLTHDNKPISITVDLTNKNKQVVCTSDFGGMKNILLLIGYAVEVLKKYQKP